MDKKIKKGKTFRKYGGYNTKTKELQHIYDSPLQVEMCYPQGKHTKNLNIVELEVTIKKNGDKT